MIELSHDAVVGFSKTFGLLYLVVLSIGITVYACWPSNKNKFDHSAKNILKDEDGPCQ